MARSATVLTFVFQVNVDGLVKSIFPPPLAGGDEGGNNM